MLSHYHQEHDPTVILGAGLKPAPTSGPSWLSSPCPSPFRDSKPSDRGNFSEFEAPARYNVFCGYARRDSDNRKPSHDSQEAAAPPAAGDDRRRAALDESQPRTDQALRTLPG